MDHLPGAGPARCKAPNRIEVNAFGVHALNRLPSQQNGVQITVKGEERTSCRWHWLTRFGLWQGYLCTWRA